jgi:hypothetical protein
MNRQEFDATFAGHDLASQVRAAIDFAQQHNLALGRSAGDQHFIFSRLQSNGASHAPERKRSARSRNRSARRNRRNGNASRPFGRSF